MKKMSALVVDLDETLIANSFLDARPSPYIQVTEVDFGDWTDKIILRPFTETFLVESRAYFDRIILASFSSMDRIVSILETLNLVQCFDGAFSWEDFGTAEGDLFKGGDINFIGYDLKGDFALLDDRGWNDHVVISKMAFFGIPVVGAIEKSGRFKLVRGFKEVADHLIQIPPYHGDPEDGMLLDLLCAFQVAAEEEDAAMCQEGA